MKEPFPGIKVSDGVEVEKLRRDRWTCTCALHPDQGWEYRNPRGPRPGWYCAEVDCEEHLAVPELYRHPPRFPTVSRIPNHPVFQGRVFQQETAD